MDSQIINANIKISEVSDTGTQIKIKDENKKTYSFFKNKKDGGATVAFEQFQNYKVGEEVGIGYKEVPFTGKDGTQGKIKSIMNFGPLRAEIGKPAPRAESKATEPVKTEGRNWDREAYEKCCSIWSQGITVESALKHIEVGDYWQLFQAIRKDGEKRFATGWAKAAAIYGTDPEVDEANAAIDDAIINDMPL